MKFIDRIIRFSLQNNAAILAGTLLLLAGGLYSARKTDVDVFPDLTAPTVVIMTDAHGMAAEEVERLVTFPIETAVNGAADVRRVRSSSLYGYSFVWTEFDWGTDLFKARQTVSEKMTALVGTLPEGITPIMAPQSSVMGEILFVGLQSDTTSMMELRTLADWVIKPAILATGGVSQVTVIGGDGKQYQILADPLKMQTFGVSLEDLERAGTSLSTNSTGGIVRDFGNEYVLVGIGRSADTAVLGQTLVKQRGGRPVFLSDVAKVRTGNAPRMGYASQDARPAVILSISKQPNINTLAVTEKIEANLDEIRKSLPPDVRMDTRIFRQADFIGASVRNVGRALLEGALFVIVILFLFLGSFRTTVISVIAIPLSLFGTLIALHLLGMNINTMTLGGMCIAIGSLVDDAIIDVENVYKRLRENHRRPAGQRESAFSVVFEASKEIRSSILNATFIIMAAFIPLFFLSGMEGRMLKPLGMAYILSLFMSLAIAMTVTPLLCKFILTDERYLERKETDSWLVRKLTSGYSRSLLWAFANRKIVLGSTAAALAGAAILFFTMGRSFLPDFNEGSATISAVAEPGVSLEVSNELGNLVEQELLTIPEVTGTARRSGRGELDEHSQATNGAEIDVRFAGRLSREAIFQAIREKLAGIPGIVATVGQPLGHRIDHMLSGTRASIAIKIFGTDLVEMQRIGKQVKASIDGIEGLVDLAVEPLTQVPQIQIRANRAALAEYGIGAEAFNRFIALAFQGEKLAEIFEGQRRYDLVLRLDDRYAGSVDAVRDALVDLPGGGKVPLGEIAEIVSTGGPNAINRENVQRKLVVSANVSGRDVKSVVDDIKISVGRNIPLPEGYRIEYGGQFVSARNASRTLATATIAALLVIFLLLYGEFRSAPFAGIVLAGLPLALIGGVLAVSATSRVISIPSIIGFITLFGIATRNGILLISRYKHLQEAGVPLHDAVLSGAVDRLNPILMTALTSALALIPLVLSGDQPGNEIQSPMAAVVLGGLLTSTLLNLYVMPIVYAWFAGRNPVQKQET